MRCVLTCPIHRHRALKGLGAVPRVAGSMAGFWLTVGFGLLVDQGLRGGKNRNTTVRRLWEGAEAGRVGMEGEVEGLGETMAGE